LVYYIAFGAACGHLRQSRSLWGISGEAKVLKKRCSFRGYGKRVLVENIAVSDGIDHGLWLYPGRWKPSFEWNIMGHDVGGNKTEPGVEIPAT
jgi:hypothetical protein